MIVRFYVSTEGNDTCAGTMPDAKTNCGDGPFATIGRAQEAVRELIKKGLAMDVEVSIRGGRYELTSPLLFSMADSGTDECRVIYKAYQNEVPVISGGRILLCSWQKSSGNLWCAKLKDPVWFRDLYADGKRMPRSRYPKAGKTGVIWELTAKEGRASVFLDGWTWRTKDIAGQNAELVMLNVWSVCRSRILSSNLHTFELENIPGWVGHNETTPKPGYRAFIEHSLDFVDDPGEWFLDKKNSCLYFMAAEGQSPNSMEFIVPALDKMLVLRGTQNTPIKNLCFEGLSFEHSKWDIPPLGYSGTQAGHHGTKFGTEPTYALPAAIDISYSKKCLFEKCRFSHIGASAIAISAGSHNNVITHSEICDIGGNGIFVGWREKSDKGRNKHFEHDWDDIADAPCGNQIINNKIHNCGAVQFDTVGVCVAYSPKTKISRNNIYDLPYTGISVGYIWGTEETTQRDCEISSNHIHHVMQVMYDGGAIYTLGSQPGTVIANNLIHDVPNGHGLYTDQGSSHIVLTGNIVFNVGILAYQHHWGVNVTLRNNIFYGSKSIAFICPCREDVESQVIAENNIICIESGELFGGGWPWKQLTLRNNIYWDNRWPISARTKDFVEEIKNKEVDPGAIFADPGIRFQDSELIFSSDSMAYRLGFRKNFFAEVGTNW